MNLLNSSSEILGTLTQGFNAAESAIISAIASIGISELIKLAKAELTTIWKSLTHFVSNLRAGMAWGAAQASMLTEVWNGTKSALADLATDFVNAVGKVFENAGLLSPA